MKNVNNTLEARKQRWSKFMAMDPEVKITYIVNCAEDSPTHPPFWPKMKKQEWLDYALRLYDLQTERMEWLLDDTIPHLDLLTGTEVFAETMGCKVHRGEDQMPFALPFITDASQVSKIKVPRLDTSPLCDIFEIADKLYERAGKNAVFRLPDVQSPMDIAALMWDKNDFYIALIEEPQAVKELAEKIRYLLTAFFDEWFKRYGTDYVAHFPTYFMNKGLTLSEDEVGVVNTQMFDEFFLPELKFLSDRYGGLGIHCCANSRHQWDNFKKIPNLKLLNLNQPKEILEESFSYFADFVPMMHAWCGDGPAWTWVDQRKEGAWTCFETSAASKKEAKDISERLWEACRR